jgi:hypothetical protein
VKDYLVRQYKQEDKALWNTFVAGAKNATFLFDRDFMEYHADRFEDFSLLIFEDDKLIAVLPANKVENEVFSHQGLTYGGLVYAEKLKLEAVIIVLGFVLQFLKEEKIATFHLKTIPSIYHKKPAEELLYALFLAQATLVRRDTLSVVDLSKKFSLSTLRKRGVKKGLTSSLVVREEVSFEGYWNQILIPNLNNKYQTKPVHTLAEITKLKSRFPACIRQFNVYQNGIIVAGTTVFESDQVAHAQYISGNDTKDDNGSLDFLFEYLLKNVFKEKKYFDFGISNELQGKKLNLGLSYWKESFGASTIVHDFYQVPTSNGYLLENISV